MKCKYKLAGGRVKEPAEPIVSLRVWNLDKSPLNLLQQVFGYHEFHENQREIIECVLSGNDAFVLMPTGGGKSLCYQIPAMIAGGVGIVVSPLIALMEDQVKGLWQCGVRAAYLNSTLSYPQLRQVYRSAADGRLDLLYVAPEKLLTPDFQHFLTNLDLALFAIDEAHCVSQWEKQRDGKSRGTGMILCVSCGRRRNMRPALCYASLA